MKISDALRGATRLFLDTAPVVYYVEEDARYVARVDSVFDRVDAGALSLVVSPVTLAECLVVPLRQNRVELQQAFVDLLVHSGNTTCVLIDAATAMRAAEFRARHNLALPDALQAATALVSGCDALLTNDPALKRVTELKVIVLDEVEPD